MNQLTNRCLRQQKFESWWLQLITTIKSYIPCFHHCKTLNFDNNNTQSNHRYKNCVSNYKVKVLVQAIKKSRSVKTIGSSDCISE